MPPPDPALRRADRAEAEALVDVSRETWRRLDALVAALDRWQATTNLVALSTLDLIWTRHVADSAQLVALAPATTGIWVDLGAGGGFPGLVVAAMLGDRAKIHLVESTAKKAAFLRETARAMELSVVVHAARAEDVVGRKVPAADVVSARALAPLGPLLALAAPLLKTGAIGLFPKGATALEELTEARESWTVEASLHPSLTDPAARIIRVHGLDERH